MIPESKIVFCADLSCSLTETLHSSSIRITDGRVCFSINWRGTPFWIRCLTLIVWRSALRLRHPFIQTSSPKGSHAVQGAAGMEMCVSLCVCVCVCLSAGSRPREICQSFRDPSASVRRDNEVDTDFPAVPACLAVWLTDDTDSFTPSRSEALHHSLLLFFIQLVRDDLNSSTLRSRAACGRRRFTRTCRTSCLCRIRVELETKLSLKVHLQAASGAFSWRTVLKNELQFIKSLRSWMKDEEKLKEEVSESSSTLVLVGPLFTFFSLSFGLCVWCFLTRQLQAHKYEHS